MEKLHFVLNKGVYPYRVGGMEIFNYYLIKSLKDEYDISYTSCKPLDLDGLDYNKCRDGIQTIFFPLQLLIYLLRHKKLNMVIFSFSRMNWLIWYQYYLICKFLKKKYFVVIHLGDIPPKGHDRCYKIFLKHAKKVVAVSEGIKTNYDTKYGLNCKVIYPLVPFPESNLNRADLRQKYKINKDVNVICMIGSLKEMKNPDTILNALSLFTIEEKKVYKPYIIYAGNGVMIETLKQLVEEYQLKDSVSFLGNIPKEDVCEILKLADIYLIASDYEGTSVSLLEAMYNKKVIIASRAPGIINTIVENEECLMFEPRNAAVLKQCVIKVLSDEKLRINLSHNSYMHFLNDYDYRKVISSYKMIFSE